MPYNWRRQAASTSKSNEKITNEKISHLPSSLSPALRSNTEFISEITILMVLFLALHENQKIIAPQ